MVPTYPGCCSIIKCRLHCRLDLGFTAQEIVDFFPTVVIRVHHSSHLSLGYL